MNRWCHELLERTRMVTPKAFNKSAQGCEERATLGIRYKARPTLKELKISRHHGNGHPPPSMAGRSSTSFGVGRLLGMFPG